MNARRPLRLGGVWLAAVLAATWLVALASPDLVDAVAALGPGPSRPPGSAPGSSGPPPWPRRCAPAGSPSRRPWWWPRRSGGSPTRPSPGARPGCVAACSPPVGWRSSVARPGCPPEPSPGTRARLHPRFVSSRGCLPGPDDGRGRPRAFRGRTPAGAPTVIVGPGDCLWRLAEASLPRDATDAQISRRWHRIYALNRAAIGADPDLIQPGQRLRLPPRGEEHDDRHRHHPSPIPLQHGSIQGALALQLVPDHTPPVVGPTPGRPRL